MKIIIGDRGSGKTESLIRMSAESQSYIVARDRRSALGTLRQAEALGLRIPFPLTYDEFLDKAFYRGSPALRFLVDDAEALLARLADGQLAAITLTREGDSVSDIGIKNEPG